MSREMKEQSVERLADALGQIDDNYIEEARANAPGGEIRENVPDASVMAGADAGTDTKNTTIKWKKRSRKAGILIAAACVVIIAAAVILLPKNEGKKAASAVQEAAIEDAGEDAAEAVSEAAAAEEVAEEAAEEAAAGAQSSEESGMAMEQEGSGFAVRYMHVVVDPSTKKEPAFDYPDGYEPDKGLIIESRAQLEDYLASAELETEGTIWFNGNVYGNLTDAFDDAFFEKHHLALSFVEVSSGSYQVNYLSASEDGKTLQVSYNVYRPDRQPDTDVVITTDMADWMLVTVVSENVEEIELTEEEYPYE